MSGQAPLFEYPLQHVEPPQNLDEIAQKVAASARQMPTIRISQAALDEGWRLSQPPAAENQHPEPKTRRTIARTGLALARAALEACGPKLSDVK